MFLQKKDFAMALKWLRRAQGAISSCEVDELSLRGLEIRLAICQSLVRTHLGQGSPRALQEAESLVANMETQLGDKPIVLHWRLEILQHAPREEVNTNAYATILRRMIRAFDNSDETFVFLLHHIKELGDRATQLACALLDELLLQRVVPSKQMEHIGKALVRRIWFAIQVEEHEGSLSVLVNLLNTLYEMLQTPVESPIAGAVHAVRLLHFADSASSD